jgi:hypothetical protein
MRDITVWTFNQGKPMQASSIKALILLALLSSVIVEVGELRAFFFSESR